MAGAILKFQAEGAKVGVLGPDQRRADAVWHAGKTGGRDGSGDEDAGAGLAAEPGPAQPQPGADFGGPARAGGCHSPDAAEVAVCPLLGRCSSGSCRGDAACRGGPLLGQAVENRHAGRAVASAADLQLLLRASEAGRPAGVHSRHQPLLGTQAGRDSLLSQPVHRRPASRGRRRFSISCATKPPIGARLSASPTANPSPAASRSG